MQKYPPETGLGVTAEDLRCIDWQAMLVKATKRECYAYSGVLSGIADELEKAGNDRVRRAVSLVAWVTSFWTNYDSSSNPYGPIFPAGAIHKDDIVALAGALDAFKDAELRARVGDIVWESSRNHVAARVAVEAFLESAKKLEPEDLWSPFALRLERALQLAAKLGFGQDLHRKVIAEVEATIARHETKPTSGLLCARLMDSLLRHDAGDANRHAQLCERKAKEFETAKNWDFAEQYWSLAVRCHREARSEAGVSRCALAGAECIASKGEDILRSGRHGKLAAAQWLGNAVEAFRRAKANPARIEAAHQRLLEVQPSSLSEMETIEVDPEKIPGLAGKIEQAQAEARAHVTGKTLQEAIFRFAFLVHPSRPSEIRKQVEDANKEFIFNQLVGSAVLDESGKVAAQAPPVGVGTAEQQEDAMRDQVFRYAREITWPTHVNLFVEPARQQLRQEHSLRLWDLKYLVENNPFIPQGHENIYLRGLQAGFHGDWLAAMHLLIPQLENSIRHVLTQKGVVTSWRNTEGIQEDFPLEKLLNHPKATEVFGEDIVFDLRGILIARFGHNLRNSLAHGKVASAGFYMPASTYLWWLTLRLCCIGYRCLQNALAEQSAVAPGTPPAPE